MEKDREAYGPFSISLKRRWPLTYAQQFLDKGM